MNKRELGKQYEEKACEYMCQQGFHVLERNFRCKQGEIDIIGEHEGYLVFAEVKYRTDQTAGDAAEAVTYAKQKRICKTADYYRYLHGIGEDRAVRYDVVAIQGEAEDGAEEIRWYKNAFWHIYAGRKGRYNR